LKKLSKKGQRLYDYLKSKSEKVIISVEIGDICRDCHTTVYTLFKKTYCELLEKNYADQDGNLLKL
jgi:hypothetical protein